MKKLLKKKVNVFGKGIPVLAIFVLGIALVSAALLGVYGSITGMVTTTQSVLVVGDGDVFEFNQQAHVEGKSFTDCGYSVKNNAEVEAPVILKTTCGAEIEGNDCDGVTTDVYGVLELTKKNIADWQPIAGTEIELTYTIVGDTFTVTDVNNALPGAYVLVYAMDKQDRFEPASYATVMKVGEVGSQNLPFANDWNAGENANYCNNVEGDHYVHCRGAKIWAIPESVITGESNGDGTYKLTWANMASYYWETDLIVYSSDTEGKITLPAGGGFDFCVDNSFALNLVPDTYTVNVSIIPN